MINQVDVSCLIKATKNFIEVLLFYFHFVKVVVIQIGLQMID